MKWLLVLCLAGCASLGETRTAQRCVAADVASTIGGVERGRLKEVVPFLRGSINAHHFIPMLLVAGGVVWAIDYLSNPKLNTAVTGVECGLAAHNLFVAR